MQYEITFALYAAMSHHKFTWNYLPNLKLKDPLSKLLSSFSCVFFLFFFFCFSK